MLNDIKQDAQTRMAKSIDALKHTLTSIRTGRASPALLDLRRRDHERIDEVLASRVGEEDIALQRVGGRRTPLDRVLAPANRQASRLFLRVARSEPATRKGDVPASDERSYALPARDGVR